MFCFIVYSIVVIRQLYNVVSSDHAVAETTNLMKCVFLPVCDGKDVCVCLPLHSYTYVRTVIHTLTITLYTYPTGVYMYTWRMEPEWVHTINTYLHAYNSNFIIMRKITLSSTHTLYYIIYLHYLYIVQGIYAWLCSAV